jgi:acyl-CoA thioesterase-2
MAFTPLATLIQLEQLDTNLFRGQNFPVSWGQVFGGQVLAQSIHAARQTVEKERELHSMHAYFILPGNLDTPIIFQVDPIRDGGSFNTRRVVALQNGRAIFNMSASFQVREEGFAHQDDRPNVTHYEDLITDLEWAEKAKDRLPPVYKQFMTGRHIEFRPVEQPDWMNTQNSPPFKNIWFKCEESLPDDLALHKEVLAFASDYNLMSTSLLPHKESFEPGKLQLASLAHAMWFHREFRVDQWLLFSIDSPSASNSRGFNRGSFFTEDGSLVASVAQEGLIRKKH